MQFDFGPRRGDYIDIADEISEGQPPASAEELKLWEDFDLIYRSLCAVMYNYVPMSGHPGGSISSGRFVASLLFETMAYDFENPDRADSDIISYAAGHKALGLYGMWALRDEVARIAAPELLPKTDNLRLRLEDLLGFRRNPTTSTTLFTKFNSKPLDGHPTPATPFVKLSTGASGVGVATSLGLAYAAADYFGKNAPQVHLVEGEGGMTPGRVAEAFAAAGTASLGNTVIHIDWNQASIDSNRVCRDGQKPGDYVQWTPAEFAYLHDWNVIFVPDGRDFVQVLAAQRKLAEMESGQPTAVVYQTTKGWKYGIEGKASHGAGHKLCSDGFYDAIRDLTDKIGAKDLPCCKADEQRCKGDDKSEVMETCYWETLGVIRKALEDNKPLVEMLAGKLKTARTKLENLKRTPRNDAPNIEAIYTIAEKEAGTTPKELMLETGKATTLRGALGNVLNYYNKKSGGAMFAAAADLLGSTSTTSVAKDFPEGFWNTTTNTGSRLLSIGGICEDAIAGVLAGISTFGHHIGIGSSYGAFIAPLGHIASRLHAIGCQSRQHMIKGEPYKPFFLVCAHAGLKTGEDGPTHADPQPLQLLQENFPRGTAITLTPWDPQEIWTLVSTALAKRPAVIAPFVTRPNEMVFDRKKMGFSDASESKTGLYALKKAKGEAAGTVVLQGSGVTYAFIQDALPKLEAAGVDLNIYYVASAELFDMLPLSEQQKIFPESESQRAMGITGLTLPTMYRWVTSEKGRAASLYPFKKGHFLGSGQADMVLGEAGLDGESQYKAIMSYLKE